MVHPMAPAAFLATHWERAPAFIPRGDAEYYDGLYSMENVSAIIDAFPKQRLNDDFVVVNRAFVTPRRIENLTQAYAAYLEGYTTSMFIVNRLWHPLGDLCRELGADLGFPLRTNMYLTPRDAKGFLPHSDSHDFFITQMAGVKRWRVYRSPVYLPTRDMELGKVPGRDIDAAVLAAPPLLDVVLRPGDVLYVPRGFIHEAETSDESGSMHLTVRVLNSFFFTWGHFFQFALPADKTREGQRARGDWERRRRAFTAAARKQRESARAAKGGWMGEDGGGEGAGGESGDTGGALMALPAMVPLSALSLRQQDAAFRESLPWGKTNLRDDADESGIESGDDRGNNGGTTDDGSDGDAGLEECPAAAAAAAAAVMPVFPEGSVRSRVCEDESPKERGKGQAAKKSKSSAARAKRKRGRRRCRPRREWIDAFARALTNTKGAVGSSAAPADARRLLASAKELAGGGEGGGEEHVHMPGSRTSGPAEKEHEETHRAVATWLKKHLNVTAALEKLEALNAKIEAEHKMLLGNVRSMFPTGMRPEIKLDAWVVVRGGLCLLNRTTAGHAAVSTAGAASAAGAAGAAGAVGDAGGINESDFYLAGGKQCRRQNKAKGRRAGARKPAPNGLKNKSLRFRAALRPLLQEVIARASAGDPFHPMQLRAAADDFERIALIRILRDAGALDLVNIVRRAK